MNNELKDALKSFRGFKPTKLQYVYLRYLRFSRKLILALIRWHEKIAEKGYSQHPCWAGGFDLEEGVVSQPCDACAPFYAEESWASSVRRIK